MTFRELGLIAPILSALEEQGYVNPSPIQEKAIPPALEGRDVLGCAQTGTGKTCAFAAPILQSLNAAPAAGHPIRSLILTPTRELAIQIEESFEAYGKHLPLRCAVVFGGVSQGPQVQKLKRGVDILVATPGRLGDLYQQKLLDLSGVEIFVLDEADRMLDMGFIQDVKRILTWLPTKKQTLFFSATMPKEITALVNSLLKNPVRVAVDPVSSPVEAISQSVYFVDKANKTKLLARLVKELDVKNALVFARTKHGANKVAQDLEKFSISASAIHGNKSQTARQQALADFKSGKLQVLVATDIAARGLDIEDLSHVVNYNLPEVPETYVHRIGRTGRAGREGAAFSFCDFSEKPLLRDIERLIARPISVIEGHPYPLSVFDLPKKDRQGRIINAEDEEARLAAKELRRTREAAKQAAGQTRTPAASRAPAARSADPAPTAGKKKHTPGRPESAPAQSRGAAKRDDRPKMTRPGSRMETGHAQPQTEFSRPNPLSGDRVMDATARLLAPRHVTLTSAQSGTDAAANAGKGPRQTRGGAGRTEQVAPAPHTPAGTPARKREDGRPARKREWTGKPTGGKGGRDGRRTPGEPMHSAGQAKDSTEQPSLMKPYYLDIK